MQKWAIIEDNKVVNVILWDSETSFSFDGELIEITDTHAGIGWDYVDGEFIDNRPQVDEEVPNVSE